MKAHLSPQLQHRFLARLLSPEETLDVIKHLRECDACREKLLVLRSNKPGSLVDIILLEMPEEKHPSSDSLGAYLDDDLARPDQADVEEHLQTCQACRKTLADLRIFREELLQMPQREYTFGTTSPTSPTSGSLDGGGLFRDKPRFFSWFSQPPLVLAGAVAVAVLLLAIGIIIVRSPGTLGIARAGPQIAVADGGHQILLDPNGIVNPPAALPENELAALNHLAVPVWRDERPVLSPSLQETLNGLKRAPSVLLGQPQAKVPFQALSPIRTLTSSVRPTFKWTTAPGATSYTVHLIADDRTQEEAATSSAIPAAVQDVTTCTWTIPESTSLAPGKRYRWYVTAVIDRREIDAPGMEQSQAKFGVLSAEALAQLDSLKKQTSDDRLLNGLLDLNAGLLDDAENDFQMLLDDPKQTPEAKEFLNRMIGEIQRLKET
jgi:anti-sigma factor RsiW